MIPGVKTGIEVEQVFDYAMEVTRMVCEAVNVPVMIKVTPQVASLVAFSGKLMNAEAKATVSSGSCLTSRSESPLSGDKPA